MGVLQIALFGRFQMQSEEGVFANLTGKAQQVFAYLLLHRDSSHHREALGDLFWRESSTARKCLRQALWKLQAAVKAAKGPANLLLRETHWVRLNPDADLWIDVAAFEQILATVPEVPGTKLDESVVQSLETAVRLYQGDLLEGYYQDWCLRQRRRLRGAYLNVLDQLVDYYVGQHDYTSALAYANRALALEPAREHTHQQLMRLYALAGDRTAALRQYEHCAALLEKELAVAPAEGTRDLYEQIRSGRKDAPDRGRGEPVVGTESLPAGAFPRRLSAPLVLEERPLDDNSKVPGERSR
jgi:DNA-binding SARP family transcriptional activator